jgi:osmotically-inducible protein OsmY
MRFGGRRSGGEAMRTAVAAAIGAALAYFFDPQNGARRRNVTRDRVTPFFLRRARDAARAGRGMRADTYGVSQKLQHRREEPKDLDDATLAQKVQSELFRDADAPKGAVSVNVQDGVVQLRGEVESRDLIDDLVAGARQVAGVRRVENLLHLPGETALMHQ